MFWIFGRKSADKAELANRKPLTPLYEGDRGIRDLDTDDVELRVWVPVTVYVALKDMAVILDKTASRYLREFFAIYLYGAHDFEGMRQSHTGVFYDVTMHPADYAAMKAKLEKELQDNPRSSTPAMFSRAPSVDFIPGLGKNIVPLKLFLHEKMKADLQALADKAGIPLSQFVREVLVSHFLGHTVWPERNQLWTREQQEVADGWELGGVEEDQVISPSDEEEEALEGKVEYIRW